MGNGSSAFPLILGEFQMIIGMRETEHDTVIPVMLRKFSNPFQAQSLFVKANDLIELARRPRNPDLRCVKI